MRQTRTGNTVTAKCGQTFIGNYRHRFLQGYQNCKGTILIGLRNEILMGLTEVFKNITILQTKDILVLVGLCIYFLSMTGKFSSNTENEGEEMLGTKKSQML